MDSTRNPDDVKEFLIESQAYLDSVEPILASLQAQSGGTDEDISGPVATVFRAFHSIKGVAGFLSFANVQELTHKAEETLDRVRAGKRVFDRELGTVLLESCDLLRKYFAAIHAAGDDAGYEPEKAGMIERLKSLSGPGTQFSAAASVLPVPVGSTASGWIFEWALDEGAYERFSTGAIDFVGVIEQSLIVLLDEPTRLSIFTEAGSAFERLRLNAAAFGFPAASAHCASLSESLRRPRSAGSSFDPSEMGAYFNACNALKPLLQSPSPTAAMLERGNVTLLEVAACHTPKSPSRPAMGSQSSGTGTSGTSQTNAQASNGLAADSKGEIRVSLERLDKMVDLIEELGVVSTGVFSSSEAAEDGSNLRNTASKLRKITEELQEITVSIRMVPLSSVFRKMIRLVGDVSNKLGKKARLEIVGEQTELDKDAVEALQDPLVHILRNCLDHGLESPEERMAAGKPETGVLRLQAWHSGGEAWISISDDGRGIASEKVLAKAVSQGLVAANTALSNAEILAFLFHPGFSMAKEVTEFSGRGVGMDVVKKNIVGLKGRVDLESKPGTGTSFLIRLPMANALTESMLVRVGGVKYVLRVASIRETFQPTKASVTRLPDGDELVSLRGHLYPVVRLHQVHNIAGAETDLERGLIIIVENRGKQTGLFVDEVLGKIQAVIKPPPSFLKAAQTLAGCSIIGTESDAVALALDINALDERAAQTARN